MLRFAKRIWVVLVILLAGICYWLADHWFSIANNQLGLQERLQQTETTLQDLEKRLMAVIQINNELAETTDEQTLMQSVLGLLARAAASRVSSQRRLKRSQLTSVRAKPTLLTASRRIDWRSR